MLTDVPIIPVNVLHVQDVVARPMLNHSPKSIRSASQGTHKVPRKLGVLLIAFMCVIELRSTLLYLYPSLRLKVA